MKSLLVLLTMSPVLIGTGCGVDRGWMGMGSGHGYGMGGGVMWLFWLVILGAIGYGLYAVISKKADTGIQDPLDILKRRYAKGEIDKESYERMKKDLGG